jgi:shikimate dehydrogenase
MSRRAGLIGDPVAHSISPAFQQAAFDALGIDVRYEPWRTTPAGLPERVAWLRSPGVIGANVTVPHKQAVMGLLDEVAPPARRAGAVNTVVNRDGRLHGHNTDIEGFVTALRLEGGFDPRGSRVALVGAGGAARAVLLALLDAGADDILILNRSVGRAEALVAELGEGRATALALDTGREAHTALLGDRSLIVNCTTIGMRHSPAELDLPLCATAIPEGSFVCDIVANPLETPLMRAATARGCRTLGGLAMLVRQGATSFELWTGEPAPIAVMFEAARQAMSGPPSYQ